jgi:hypothetical protein
MQEHDPTAVDPDDAAQPAEGVEDQTPPPGYEPQVDLQPNQEPGVTERAADSIEDVEAEEPNVSDEEAEQEGNADDGDDDAEDGDPGEPDDPDEDDGAANSQQEAEQDSALQTPQPDQAHPPVSDSD